MLAPNDDPFDASKYAIRTNFDGLTITDTSVEPSLEDAKKGYQNALTRFESADKKAWRRYEYQKEVGMTDDDFGTWDPSWSAEMQNLAAKGGVLTQAAMAAYGSDYQAKHEKDLSALNNAAYQAGHSPAYYRGREGKHMQRDGD